MNENLENLEFLSLPLAKDREEAALAHMYLVWAEKVEKALHEELDKVRRLRLRQGS